MKQKINVIIIITSFFAMILGCGESKPKEWTKAKPITERLDHPQALQNDEKFLYFITGGTVASKNEGTNNLLKMPIGGGNPSILFKGGDVIPDANAIALDKTHVYFSANGLQKISKEGGQPTLLTKVFMPSEIVLDDENVYWMPYVGEGMPPAPIYSVSKNGGEPKTLTDARPSANGLCVDEKFIYWAQTDGIYKKAKQAGNIEKIYSASTGNITSGLKKDNENFYFLQGESKKDLFKLAKSGGEAKMITKNVSEFWLGENEIVFNRFITSFGIAIFKISKNGEGETELDKDGHLADLTISKNKVYMSDVIKIYELDK